MGSEMCIRDRIRVRGRLPFQYSPLLQTQMYPEEIAIISGSWSDSPGLYVIKPKEDDVKLTTFIQVSTF